MLFGQCFASKAPPLEFLNSWLALYGLPTMTPDCYVRFDLGGELGRCNDVVQLFTNAGYHVKLTAPDSSHQNGPGEWPHRTIADGICMMLAGAALAPKFWPYAFHHFLRIYNCTPHGSNSVSPYEICSQKKPDLSSLRVFGCRVFALPACPRRPDKLTSDARTGIFLGFLKTFKNIMYYDVDTETVKTAQHVVFDETMVDHPSPPPNAQLLSRASPSDAVPATLSDAISFSDIDFSYSPFVDTSLMTLRVDYKSDVSFGFNVSLCSILRRAFISEIVRSPVPRLSLRSFRTKYLGAYVVSINDTLIFHPCDVDQVLTSLRSLAHPPLEVPLLLAPERRTAITGTTNPPPLHLCCVDIRRIMKLCPPNSPLLLVSRLVTTPMTAEERALPKLTRHCLKKLSNWHVWKEAFYKQLDSHHRDGALGSPVLIADLIKQLGSRTRLL
jgi:hypothetical protein